MANQFFIWEVYVKPECIVFQISYDWLVCLFIHFDASVSLYVYPCYFMAVILSFILNPFGVSV